MQIFAACWDFHLQYSGTAYLDRMSGWVQGRWRHSSPNLSWKLHSSNKTVFVPAMTQLEGSYLNTQPHTTTRKFCDSRLSPSGWKQELLVCVSVCLCMCVLRALLWLWASSSVPQFLLWTGSLSWTAASQLSCHFPYGGNSALARSTSCVNAVPAVWTVFHN